MKNFFAKSNPKETIQEHTDILISNYNLLKSIYPNLNLDWDILYLACLYHDLGKINKKFQERLEYGKSEDGEIPHGILSMAFIDYDSLEDEGYENEDISVLFHAVGYHHDRNNNFNNMDINNEIKLLKENAKDFKYEKLKNIAIKDTLEEDFFIMKDRIYKRNAEKKFYKYIMIKGMLNRIDYASSAHLKVENKNDFLLDYLGKMLRRWKSKDSEVKWNSLQNFMIMNRESNVVVAAQTGMGKTEAGLLWIGNNKGFFMLPLKTAINSIYKRIIDNIVTEDIENRVGLLHSDIMSLYMNVSEKTHNDMDISQYYNKTKQFSLPLTVCTIDQIFDFVYRYRGFEPKLATLSYSKIVIDEIQMYSPLLLSYLLVGIKYITKIGGKFSILTATLPKFIVEMLKEDGIEFVMPKSPFFNSINRHSIKIIDDGINSEYIERLYNKNKVLVICNTVKQAQRLYNELKDKKVDNLNLLHARFILSDRREKEEKILELGNKEFQDYGIWISTQIVEASLDIDFDLLVTELSDLAGLLQRMGRCYRNRQFDKNEYNCHVFVGSDNNKCSGVGSIIYKDIFEISRDCIINKDGILTEKEKIDMVDEVYSKKKLKGTKYYKELKNCIDYLNYIEDFEKDKAKVQTMFRNIDSETVIPLSIYNDNFDKINEYVDIINKKFASTMNNDQKRDLKYKKIKARNLLMDFTVNVRGEEVNNYKEDEIKVNKYEVIPIVKCRYDSKIGLVFSEDDKNIVKYQKFN